MADLNSAAFADAGWPRLIAAPHTALINKNMVQYDQIILIWPQYIPPGIWDHEH